MSHEADIKVAVVGGGLGGLSAALFLRRAGLEDVTVFEQTHELKEIGAGIQVAPNAVRLLRRIGVADGLEEVGIRLEIGWEFRRWQDGRVLFVQELGERAARVFGEAYYVAHRAHLLELLRDLVPDEWVRLGHRLAGVEDLGDEVELRFEDAGSERFDAVVGADGIHSVVRDVILPCEPPVFSGLSAYRCLVPAERAPELALRPACALWLGPDRHLVHYPISGGREVNVVTAGPAGDWRQESWTAEGRLEDLAAVFAGWAEPVEQLIAGATETKRYAFFDREPVKRWTEGRVAIMGDAAHPMLPFFAQGASQAIEDAAVLAGCLGAASRESVAEALCRYEALRKDRASRVQRLSRERREHHHLHDGPEQRARDAAFAEEDPIGHNEWIYAHDAEEDLERSVPVGTLEPG